MKKTTLVIYCKHCGVETDHVKTRTCTRCRKLENMIGKDIRLAKRVLSYVNREQQSIKSNLTEMLDINLINTLHHKQIEVTQ